MKVKYLNRLEQLIVGNIVLSKNYTHNLIKDAKAAIRLGAKESEETLLGAVYIAAVKTKPNTKS
jgi:hypothetical protein